MKTLRWIILIPAFVVLTTLGQALGEIIVNYLYDSVFPVNDFWGFLNASWRITFIFTTYFFFMALVFYILKIAPNRKLGSRIVLVIAVILFSIAYFYKFESKNIIQIIFDIVILTVLLISSFDRS